MTTTTNYNLLTMYITFLRVKVVCRKMTPIFEGPFIRDSINLWRTVFRAVQTIKSEITKEAIPLLRLRPCLHYWTLPPQPALHYTEQEEINFWSPLKVCVSFPFQNFEWKISWNWRKLMPLTDKTSEMPGSLLCRSEASTLPQTAMHKDILWQICDRMFGCDSIWCQELDKLCGYIYKDGC